MAVYICYIHQAGLVSDGQLLVGLKEVNGKFDIWGIANEAHKKELLAISLMAMSANKQVDVELPDAPSPPAEYTPFTRLMVISPT